MSKRYLVTLTPMGKFFFGGDMTFSVNDKETDYTSYIIRSNKFPQQTSLLGMLRFLVLRNDQIAFSSSTQSVSDRTKAIELIGAKSFEVSGKAGDFGVIKNITPCFIQVEKDGKWIDLSLMPKDTNLNIDFSASTTTILNGREVDIPQMDYKPKEIFAICYTSEGIDEPILESEIFKEDISNGINRDIHTGKIVDNALFKQISYRLNEEYRFAFYAEVDLEKFVDYEGQIVSVGADNSQFIIGISPCDNNKTEKGFGNVVTLLSPAYLTADDMKPVRFGITETIPFRCMKTETNTVKSYNKRNLVYGYSDKLPLYDRGSVFYFKTESDASSFADALKNHADFYQIGYNHFQIRNLKTNK